MIDETTGRHKELVAETTARLQEIYDQEKLQRTQGRAVFHVEEDSRSTRYYFEDMTRVTVKRPYPLGKVHKYKLEFLEMVNSVPDGLIVFNHAASVYRLATTLTETVTTDFLNFVPISTEMRFETMFEAILDTREVLSVPTPTLSDYAAGTTMRSEIEEVLHVAFLLREHESSKRSEPLQAPLITPKIAEVVRDHPGRAADIARIAISDDPEYYHLDLNRIGQRLECGSISLSDGAL